MIGFISAVQIATVFEHFQNIDVINLFDFKLHFENCLILHDIKFQQTST